MHDAFVPFEIAFAPVTACPAEASPADGFVAEPVEAPADARDAVLVDVRRFRAALADALDVQLTQLLCDVACEVLGRELQLAPADLAAIARDALERCAADGPLRLRAHPRDAAALEALELPVVSDEALRRGDLTIELRSGTIDASLGARLGALLARR